MIQGENGVLSQFECATRNLEKLTTPNHQDKNETVAQDEPICKSSEMIYYSLSITCNQKSDPLKRNSLKVMNLINWHVIRQAHYATFAFIIPGYLNKFQYYLWSW